MRSFLQKILLHPASKPLLFVLCSLPFLLLVLAVVQDTLGADPVEKVIRLLGLWALRFLCVTLAITPLRTIGKMPALLRFRRMLGLFVFFYASLHALAYAYIDQEWLLTAIASDIIKRPFILVGFLAWFLLIPLAATSFNRAIRYLGGKRWQALHKIVYAVALLAVLHFLWMRSGKQDFETVYLYGGILALLLLWRLGHAWRNSPRIR